MAVIVTEHQNQNPFQKGTEIEVTSHECGYRGAWYRATIIEPPSKKRKSNNTLVEYKYLFGDDGLTPFREKVDSVYIRPLPPSSQNGNGTFEEKDVVEANYRDGWWTCTVKKVLKNGKFRVFFENPSDFLDLEGKNLRFHWDWIDGNWVKPVKDSKNNAAELSVIVLGLKASKGSTTTTQVEEEEDQSLELTEKVIHEGGRKRGRPRKSDEVKNDSKIQKVLSGDQNAAAGNDDDEVADEDQPLLTLIEKLTSIKTKEIQIDVVEEEYSLMDNASLMDVEIELPFVKKSSIWRTIESMEVFQVLPPQKPHFRPLNETKEVYREGAAIGVMVTFTGLFEKILKLQCDDCRSVFDGILEGLLDMEKHGFDVTMLRDRVNGLVSLKDEQERILDEAKAAEKEVTEYTNEKMKFDEELEDIRKKISELQEQLEWIKLKKATKDLEFGKLQLNAEAVSERVENARREFEKLAAAPWKLCNGLQKRALMHGIEVVSSLDICV